MRQAINENRTVQLALLGVLALLGGFLVLKHTKGSANQSGSATPTASAPAATPPSDAAVPAAAPGSPTDLAGGSSSAATVPASLVPGPGLPRGLVSAFHHGKAVVLLVRRAGGIDDAFVRDSVDLLREPRVKVYVTKASGIARYAWLTQGVNVSELPALVVLRPRGLTHGTPTASVSYGFRGPNSVRQAVGDALYRGPADRPYHP